MSTRSTEQTKPRISVVVAAYNSEKYINKCLKSLTEINHDSYEIIIVDDGFYRRDKSVVQVLPRVDSHFNRKRWAFTG